MKFKTLLLVFIWAGLYSCNSSQSSKNLSIKALPIDAEIVDSILVGPSVYNDPDRFVWGGSVIYDDGKYHMLYNTWPCGDSIPEFTNSWVLYSEIAYAISDHPDRDFKFQKIVLHANKNLNNPLAWDAQMVSNPHIKKFNDKFYLYYIGSKDPGKPAIGEPGDSLSKRDRVQQNQQIGVIEFSSFEDLLNGNFERPESPILSPRTRVKPNHVINPSPEGTKIKPDNLIVVNPSVVYREMDKKYILYFKGNLYDPHWRGVHGYALSNNPNGPFTAQDDFIFDFETEDGKLASAEDPYVWYSSPNQTFYAIFKDFSGKITMSEPGLAILQSENGIDWERPANPMFMPKALTLKDKGTIHVDRLERPQLLLDEEGLPQVLFCACSLVNIRPRQDGASFNVHIPLQAELSNE